MSINNLILVSKKPIVIQIFTLVCKKLNVKLEVLSQPQINNKVDIIVMDTDFIDERFNTVKSSATLIGAISRTELPFEIANDFIVPIPFLPSRLEEIIEEQLLVIKERKSTKVYVKNIEVEPLIEEPIPDAIDEAENSVNYLDSLAQNIADNFEDDDESIVEIEPLAEGGILDANQLNEIGDLLSPPNERFKTNEFIDIENSKEDEDWQDLSSIIDQAITEVNTVDDITKSYEYEDSKNIINMKLNDFQLEELSPLLNLLDQEVIDLITKGEEITLKLKFESEN